MKQWLGSSSPQDLSILLHHPFSIPPLVQDVVPDLGGGKWEERKNRARPSRGHMKCVYWDTWTAGKPWKGSVLLDVCEPGKKQLYRGFISIELGKKKHIFWWLNYSICPGKANIKTHICQTLKQCFKVGGPWWSSLSSLIPRHPILPSLFFFLLNCGYLL